MNYMQAAFAPVEAINREIVKANTWGHLAPEPRRSYSGVILFATSEYGGDRMVIRTDFPGMNDNPWFFEDLHEWMFGGEKLSEGCVFEWRGTYTKRKNGSYHFKGKCNERIPASAQPRPAGSAVSGKSQGDAA